jgi:anti-sigma B factor antagonist
MSFTVDERPDGIIIITCPSNVTVKNSGELKKIFEESVSKGKYKFIVDLTKTRYVDSSGLGAIVSRISIARSNGGDVRIATTVPLIQNLLDVTNLNKILKCVDDVSTAISDY